MSVSGQGAGEREIVLTHEYAAPRERVFELWTQPEHIAEWYGPDGFTTTTYQMDVRPGGVWRFMMHGPDGVDYPNRIDYTDVVRPERLEFVHGSKEDDPDAFRVTVTFEELKRGRTRVTSRLEFATAEERERTVAFGAIELGKQTFARAGEYLGRLKGR